MTAPHDKLDYSPLTTFAFEALAVAGTSVGFTAATYNPTTAKPAMRAVCRVEGASIRARLDGTAPTATVGTLYEVGDEFIIWGTMDITAARFIRTGGVSATLNTHFAR